MKKIITLNTLLWMGISVSAQCVTPPTAVCQNITTYLDNSGSFTINDSDLDAGSSLNCGTTLTFSASQTTFACSGMTNVYNVAGEDLIISGIFDAPLSGGTPKGIELYVINDIADLSIYGIGSANNGLGTDGEEFTFPADVVTAGTYIYLTSEAPQFLAFFGFATDYTAGAMAINGDDAIELFKSGAVIDVFGDINTDGSGQPWEYLDGWAYRNNSTITNNGIFNTNNWIFSGANAFDGESDNATAATPMPIGTHTSVGSASTPGTLVTLTVSESVTNQSTCTALVTVMDTLIPTITCIGGTPSFELDATGNLTLTTANIDNGSIDNCSSLTLSLSQTIFTCVNQGLNSVTLYGEDASGNIDSCSMDIMVNVSNVISISSLTSADVTCADSCNASITVISTGANNYSLDGGITFQSSDSFMALCPGDYTALITSIDGCTDTMSTTINSPSPIITSFVVINETCFKDSIGEIDMTVSGGVAPYTYDWDNDGTGDNDDTEDLTNLTSGIYTIIITDANGCPHTNDTTILAGVIIDLTYSVTDFTITSNYSFGTFEWMNCADNSILVNETNTSFTATQNGSYAAVISMLGCMDTTECVEIGGIGFEENVTIDFNVYPNPTQGNISINLSNASNALVEIIDSNGKIVTTKHINNTTNTFDLSDFTNGIYFVKVKTNNTSITKKINLIK